MGFSTLVGIVRAMLFLIPFIMELFFGKAPNPYSRNPKDWKAGRPAHPWMRRLGVIVGACALISNIYLLSRLYQLGRDKMMLKQEIHNLRENLEKRPAATEPADAVCPVVEPSLPSVPSTDIQEMGPMPLPGPPPKPPKPRPNKRPPEAPPPSVPVDPNQNLKHRELVEKLKSIEDIQ